MRRAGLHYGETVRRWWLVLGLLGCERRAPPGGAAPAAASGPVIPVVAEQMTCRDGRLGGVGAFGENGLGLSGGGDAGGAMAAVPSPVLDATAIVVQGAPLPSPASGPKAGAIAVGACRAAAALRACHDAARVRRPGLDGAVDVELTVDGAGKVTASRVTASTVADDAFEACVLAALRAQDYPVAAAGVSAYGVRFRAPRAPSKGP